MSLAEYVRSVLLTCPAITNEVGEFDFHIDQIDGNPVNYSISSEPTEQVIDEYLDGTQLKRFSFQLMAMKQTFTDSDRAACSATYEQVALWLETQTRSGSFMHMQDNRTVQEITATGNPYLMEAQEDNSSSIYIMQCEIIFLQEY